MPVFTKSKSNFGQSYLELQVKIHSFGKNPTLAKEKIGPEKMSANPEICNINDSKIS